MDNFAQLWHRQMQSKIAEYRAKFRISPIGEWSSLHGSFEVMMGEVWQFNSEYTGIIRYYSVLQGEEEILFEWKEKSERTILIKTIDSQDTSDADEWETVEYDFKLVQHDEGTEVGMVQVGSEHFWLCLYPLRFIG